MRGPCRNSHAVGRKPTMKTPPTKKVVDTKKQPTIPNKGVVQAKSAASRKKTPTPGKKTDAADKKPTDLELESYKGTLLALRARLRGDVDTMADAALNKNRMDAAGDVSAMPIHMADIGSDNYEQEQTLSFVQSEHGLLEKVDEALVRMKEGLYGICESCDCRIPQARLHAIPFAVKCVKCAASDEQDR